MVASIDNYWGMCMKLRQLAIVGLLSVTGLGTAYAGGSASTVLIDKTMMDESYGEKLFIKTSSTVMDPAACSVHPVWDFVLDTSTTVLLKRSYPHHRRVPATGTAFKFSGDGACQTEATGGNRCGFMTLHGTQPREGGSFWIRQAF